MADGRLNQSWDLTSAIMSQIANMKIWVFGDSKKFHKPSDWNPRDVKLEKTKPAEPVANGFDMLKTLVLGGKFKGKA